MTSFARLLSLSLGTLVVSCGLAAQASGNNPCGQSGREATSGYYVQVQACAALNPSVITKVTPKLRLTLPTRHERNLTFCELDWRAFDYHYNVVGHGERSCTAAARANPRTAGWTYAFSEYAYVGSRDFGRLDVQAIIDYKGLQRLRISARVGPG